MICFYFYNKLPRYLYTNVSETKLIAEELRSIEVSES